MSHPTPRVLFVITARGGSKGVPGKNIKDLCGLPLLAYQIHNLRRYHGEKHIVLSTDCKKIAAVGEQYDVKVPFLRPNFLASDQAKCEDAVYHAADWVFQKDQQKFDYICMIQPTSPFTAAAWIHKAILQLEATPKASSIVSVKETRPSSYYIEPLKEYLSEISQRIAQNGLLRRQDEVKEITPSGNFYISRWEDFFTTKSFYPMDKTLAFFIESPYGLEIDEPIDFQFTDFLMKKGLMNDIEKMDKKYFNV